MAEKKQKQVALRTRLGGDPTAVPWRGKVIVRMIVPVAAQDANHAKRDVMEMLQKRMREWPWPSDVEVSTARNGQNGRTVKKRAAPTTVKSRKKRVKLSQEDVRKIRELGKDENESYSSIAKKFGASPSVVGAIINRKIWKHVD